MADYRKLDVWDLAQKLGVQVHLVAAKMQTSNNRDLYDQLRRSSLSIAANIAEGWEHKSPLEQARYLQYSISSASETENHIQTARDINSMSYADFVDLGKRVVSVRRMLRRLIERVRGRIPPDKPPHKRRRKRPCR
jgi:four helix bundle protein